MTAEKTETHSLIGLIDELKNRALAGGEVSFQEAKTLIETEDPDAIHYLADAAHELTLQFHSKKPCLCSLVNAKSYLCAEDCAFCAQSVRYNTDAARYPLMSSEEVLEAARKAEACGTEFFCVVTSGGDLNDGEFDRIIEIIERLKHETNLGIDASLGFLTPQRARRLKEAGVRRFNHNPQTSRRFYPNIVTTHSYESRIETIRNAYQAGLGVCAGGILGMGESREDRLRMAFEMKEFSPECFPVNVLNPRPGTALENRPRLEPMEIIKTIAIYRFILPKSNIKLAGGREPNLGSHQERALTGGANGLVIGGYLTTAGDPVGKDFDLLRRCGYEM